MLVSNARPAGGLQLRAGMQTSLVTSLFKPPDNGGRFRGFSLAELLVVLSIMGLFVAVSVPALSAIRSSVVLRAAAQEAAASLHFARSRAIARDVNTGVKFAMADGVWVYMVYDDIDGDGVRNDDIIAGMDVPVRGPTTVVGGDRQVRIGFANPPPNDPDTGKPFSPSAAAVQFGVSKICSFSRRGEATPGSIYLTDGNRGAAAVRVHGATGRIRILRYDGGKWK